MVRVVNLRTIRKKLSKKLNLDKLFRLNIALATVFLTQAALVLILSNNYSLPVTTGYLTKDSLASQAAGHTVLAPATNHLFDIRLSYLVVGVLFFAWAAHVLITTRLRKRYEADLKNVVHCMWIEYGLTGGLMLATIAMLNGVYDFATLIGIWALVLASGLLVYFLYRQKTLAKENRWVVNALAVITGLLPWIIVDIYLKGTLLYGSSGLPAFVYWLDGTIFLLFMAFAAIFYMQRHKKGKWADSLYAESGYMLLSLTIKTAFAWQIYASLLHK